MENSTGVANTTTGQWNTSLDGDGDYPNCSYIVPNAREMFVMHMSTPWNKSTIIVVSILCFLTCALYVEVVYTVSRSLEYGTRRGYTMFIIGLVPVFSVTSLTGIYIPRAAIIGNWAASVYLSVSLYIFLMLIVNYFGGLDAMVTKMAKTKISLSQPPLACCCPCCCRKVWLTTTNLHRLRTTVLQVAVIFPLVYFVTAVLWADGLYDPAKMDLSSPNLYLSVIMIMSTLPAMYALTIINVGVDATLANMYGTFRLRFSLIKFFMIVPSLQGIATSMISPFVSSCEGVLTPSLRASIWYNILIVAEMFVMLVFGRCKFFFNKYHTPVPQTDQPGSLSAAQTQFRYSEMSDMAASPMLVVDGSKPAFPTHLLDVEKAPLEWNDKEELAENGTEWLFQSRVRQIRESDV